MKQIFYLIKKEVLLDFKQIWSVLSIVVYLISILYCASLLFKNSYTAVAYSSVYLIVFLFTSIITTHRSFTKEEDDGGLFNYINYSPVHYMLAKVFYSVFLNIVMAFILLLLFVLLNNFVLANVGLFVLNILGLSIGLGALLSLMGSIAGKTRGNFALMSIMSFPLLLPLLILAAKLSIASIQGIPFSMNTKYLLSLFFLDGIILFLSLVLFPQMWSD